MVEKESSSRATCTTSCISSGAGEWFAAARDEGVRYGQIMAVHRNSVHESATNLTKTLIFMPFAGTEGYNPVAYIPYIVAGAIGRALGLEFPDMLLLMRLFGLVAFTAAAAYAIAVTPVLKWAFVLIALLPVAIYNRSVLSADGAALCSALVITALCLSAVWKCRAGLAALIVDDALRAEQAAANRVRAVGANGLSAQGAAPALEPRCDRRATMPYSVANMGGRSICRDSGLASAIGRVSSARAFRSNVEAPLYVGASRSFPAGDMESSQRLGGRAVAGTHWHPGLAGYCASHLDLSRAHDPSLARAFAETAAGRRDPCAVMVITGLTVLGYVAVVYLIFFLTYTPLDIDHVRGVQGRYFVIALPVAAIFVAAIINLELPDGMSAGLRLPAR